MNHETIVRTQQLKRKRRIKARLKRVFMVLACVVVFCTTYALILPAITSSVDTFCGFEEHFHMPECYEQVLQEAPVLVCNEQSLGLHVHGPECWNEENRVICGSPDFVAHSHDESCFGEDGLPVCTLPERTTHVHTDQCYRGVIPQTETAETVASHSHGEECYALAGEELICTVPESEGHTHGEGCFLPGETLLCTETDPEHAHAESCYEAVLQCTVEEVPGHAHGEECYAPLTELTCGLEEIPEETVAPSEDNLYDVPQEYELICGEVQAEVHVHGEACFNEAPQVLTCTIEEGVNHSHTELCYGMWELSCEQEEHIHDIACYADPEADLEQAADWEKSFADVELRGIWQQDVLAIARTQLGYAESTENYVVAESGVQKGYTRYGEWYGDPYGDWCAMFVSFCMHYGGVEGIPLHSGCTPWIRELKEMNLFREQGTYRPEAGDIIFFDWENDGLSDHVGLVSEVKDASQDGPAELITLEGNASNRVRYVSYDPKDTRIAGYGQLSRNRLIHTYCGLDEHSHDEACYDEAGTLLCALMEHSHSEECNSCKVVYYDNRLKAFAYIHGAMELPEDLSLKVTPILRDEDPQTYDSMSVALSEKMASRTEYVGESAFYSLQLFSQGQPYDLPEEATVSVEMSFHKPIFTAEQLEESNGARTYIITPDPNAATEEEPVVPVDVEDEELTSEPTDPAIDLGDVVPQSNGADQVPSFTEGTKGTPRQPMASATPVSEGTDEEQSSEINALVGDGAPTESVLPTETDELPYLVEPAEAEVLQEDETGITGVSFRSGEIATVAFALTRESVTGTFWERIYSKNEIVSGGTYMIVSVEGNYALTGSNSTNYKAVTLQTIKGNEKYYVISDSDNTNLHWNITTSGSSYTIRNVSSRRYVRIGNSSWHSSSAGTCTLIYTSPEKAWQIANGTSGSSYALYNDGEGEFERERGITNHENDMLIFKLSDVSTLEVPPDILTDTDGSVGSGSGDTLEMPDYPDVVDPSGSKQGETSLTGTVDSVGVTVKGKYYSDPATSDIERQYQVDSFAEHELNDGKVLSDKSVIYMGDDYGAFAEYAPNTFGVTLSTIAQEYKVTETEDVRTPIDVVFVLDVSGSMKTAIVEDDEDTDEDEEQIRIEALVSATNKAMKQIIDDHEANRVGISLYSGGAWELLPLGRYEAANDEFLAVDYESSVKHPISGSNYAVYYVVGSDTLKVKGGTKSYAGVGKDATQGFGTHIQAGLGVGRNIFNAIGSDVTYTTEVGSGEYAKPHTVRRQPVIILLSDGEPTYSTNNYMDPLNGPHYGDGLANGANSGKGIHGYYTALTANYVKRMVAIQYQMPVLFYTVGMGIYEEGDPDRPSGYKPDTDDNYKIAVLNPARDFVETLKGQSNGVNVATTTDMYRELMLSQFDDQFVTVTDNWTEVQIGRPHVQIPVLQGNPYRDDYSYANKAFFGEITEKELSEIFEEIITISLQSDPYNFILYEHSAMVKMKDNIGAGMEIKGEPILRYNGVNYTSTSISTVGADTIYVYDYTHNDPYIPNHESDLSQITVKVTRNSDGTQSVELVVPDIVLPAYTPELTTLQDYYEVLPVRLIYQVGLTEESEARVLALRETGGELTFYANKWNSEEQVAVSDLVPSDKNPYYNDVADLGTTAQYHEHSDPKSDNTTGTRDNAVDCTKFADATVDHRDRIMHYLGNNGKLVFAAESTEIPVEKHWQDANADIMNPVTLGLYRVTETVTEEGIVNISGTLVAEKQLDINNGWKDAFTGITLPDGEWYYVIVENHVTGYQAFYNGELVTFSVNNTPLTGVKVDFDRLKTEPVRVTNAPATELPSTGGQGTILYTLGGCFLIAAAAIALLYTKQGKGRKGGKAYS